MQWPDIIASIALFGVNAVLAALDGLNKSS
jgi:hypothetical protein